jgi:hypothetical protein
VNDNVEENGEETPQSIEITMEPEEVALIMGPGKLPDGTQGTYYRLVSNRYSSDVSLVNMCTVLAFIATSKPGTVSDAFDEYLRMADKMKQEAEKAVLVAAVPQGNA